jgi:hypothetical protein
MFFEYLLRHEISDLEFNASSLMKVHRIYQKLLMGRTH